MSISDKMLAGGNAVHLTTFHGELIVILTGLDAGGTFTAIRESESDMVINSELGADPRAKRMLRFMEGYPVPRISEQDRIQTKNGKIWKASAAPQDGYQSTDFVLIEMVKGLDT